MKVFEVIVEDEFRAFGSTDQGSGGGYGSVGGAAQAALAGAVGAKLAGAGKKGAAAPKPSDSKGIIAKFKNYKETQSAKLAASEAKNMKYWGTPIKWLFKFLGLMDATIQLYAALDNADEGLAKGELTPEQHKEVREFHFGIYQTQILLPTVTKLLAKGVGLVRFANWIKRIGALISAPVTGFASVAVMVSTEAFFVWLQDWIGSPEGRDWIATYLFEYVQAFGKVSTSIWDKLAEAFSKSGTAPK